MLHLDTIKIICKFLSDTDINNLLSICRKLYAFKNNIRFIEKHKLNAKIYWLPYYDSFTNLHIDNENFILTILVEDDVDEEFYKFQTAKETTCEIKRLPVHLSKIFLLDPNDKIVTIIPSTVKKITVKISDPLVFNSIKNLPIDKLIIDKIFIEITIVGSVITIQAADFVISFDKFISIFENIKYLKCIGIKYSSIKNIFKICNILTHLIFSGVTFDDRIKIGDIPQSVTHLILGSTFKQYLTENLLPNNLNYLDVGETYDNRIYPEIIPKSLNYLKMYSFSPMEDVIPLTVSYLEISVIFEIADIYPINIKHLIINKNSVFNFGKNLCKVSPILTNITFKCNYRYSLFDSIPSTVTHLTFDCDNCSSLAGCIPSSVTDLVLPLMYDKDLNRTILKSIKNLTLPKSYSKIMNKLQNINIKYHS